MASDLRLRRAATMTLFSEKAEMKCYRSKIYKLELPLEVYEGLLFLGPVECPSNQYIPLSWQAFSFHAAVFSHFAVFRSWMKINRQCRQFFVSALRSEKKCPSQ